MNPYYGTITERKKQRRDIRRWLGTSSDDAPTIGCVMNAVEVMGRLVEFTTGGRVSLVVMDNRTNGCVTPSAVAVANRYGEREIDQAGGIVLDANERRELVDLIYERVAPFQREHVEDLVNKLDHTIPA